MVVPVIAERYRVTRVKAPEMSDHLGQDAPQSISNWNHSRPIVLGGLHMEHIVHSPVGRATFQDVQGRQFARLLNPNSALHQQLQDGPVPKSV